MCLLLVPVSKSYLWCAAIHAASKCAGVSCLLRNCARWDCISRSPLKAVAVFPQGKLHLLTKHKLLTNQRFEVWWDKNEPGNLGSKRGSKKQDSGGGNVFWGKLILLIRQQFMKAIFHVRASAWASSNSLLYLEGFWSIRAPPIPKSRTYHSLEIQVWMIIINR